MYCEKCMTVYEGDSCPSCGKNKGREVKPDDVCFLTEQDFISSGILEDVLKQNGIPHLRKNVMGAGVAIKVGPMLERSRFYVPYPRLQEAAEVVEELFSPADGEPAEQDDP